MFFAKINLLSVEKKKQLDQLVRFIFFKELVEIILLVSALLSIILLLSQSMLQREFNDLSQSATLVSREFSHYNQEIRKINSIIKKFNDASKNYSPLSPKILEFINKTPNDIKINFLNIDQTVGTIIISGTAKTRDSLLSYQDSLKKYTWISGVQTPISQLFQKENVNFQINAQIKKIGANPPIKTNQPAISDNTD
jgi:Tfp pilus assembly protein PilN